MGRNVQVMLPYADSLKYMADWFCQLWAESLGKNKRRDGSALPCRTDPGKALGVTDQHSQLQLYNEGPVRQGHHFHQGREFPCRDENSEGL